MSSKPGTALKVAVVGAGDWGLIYLQKLLLHPSYQVLALVDRKLSHRDSVKTKSWIPSDLLILPELSQLKDMKLDAVFLLTGVATRYETLKTLIGWKFPVFTTKPLTLLSSQVEDLVSLSVQAGLAIEMDHTFLFHPAYPTFRSAGLNAGANIFSAQRFQWGKFQSGSNILWELAYHDIYLAMDLLNSSNLKSVQCLTAATENPNFEDSAAFNILFENGCRFIGNYSMTSAVRHRVFQLKSDDKLVSWNDLAEKMEIQVHQGKLAEPAGGKMGGTLQLCETLSVDSSTDAINQLLNHFASRLESHDHKNSSLKVALQVTKIIEQLLASKNA